MEDMHDFSNLDHSGLIPYIYLLRPSAHFFTRSFNFTSSAHLTPFLSLHAFFSFVLLFFSATTFHPPHIFFLEMDYRYPHHPPSFVYFLLSRLLKNIGV
jgi:hypothetical protein